MAVLAATRALSAAQPSTPVTCTKSASSAVMSAAARSRRDRASSSRASSDAPSMASPSDEADARCTASVNVRGSPLLRSPGFAGAAGHSSYSDPPVGALAEASASSASSAKARIRECPLIASAGVPSVSRLPSDVSKYQNSARFKRSRPAVPSPAQTVPARAPGDRPIGVTASTSGTRSVPARASARRRARAFERPILGSNESRARGSASSPFGRTRGSCRRRWSGPATA